MKRRAAGTARVADDSHVRDAAPLTSDAAPYRRRVLSDVELRIDAMKALEPERYASLLAYYFALLGDAIVDVGDAVERAERGQKPHGYALDEPQFRDAYTEALEDVRAERQRRDAQRASYDRMAAALLAESRLREREAVA